jgi:hypothetical protein
VTAKEKHTRVSAIIPAVAEDKTGTPTQGVSVRGGQVELQNVEHDLRGESGVQSLSVVQHLLKHASRRAKDENNDQEPGEPSHDLRELD